MKAIPFKEQTTVAAKEQPQYNPLPCHINSSPNGEVTTCWKLTWPERIKLLCTGKMWMQLLMFRDTMGNLKPITPSRLSVHKTDLIYKKPMIGINFDVLQSSLREVKKKYPPKTDLVIIIHDDLYNSECVDIPVTEERLGGGVVIVPLSVAKDYVTVDGIPIDTQAFTTGSFLIVESFYRNQCYKGHGSCNCSGLCRENC